MIRLSHTQARTLADLAKTREESPDAFVKPRMANSRTMERLRELGLADLRWTAFGDAIGRITDDGLALLIRNEIPIVGGRGRAYWHVNYAKVKVS